MSVDLAVRRDQASPIRLAYGRDWLPGMFRERGYRRGAEIGVWKGEFSEALCQANPDLRLLCIDPWTWYPAYQAQRNTKNLEAAYAEAVRRLAPYHCLIRRLCSVEAAREIPDRSLDFVYLDGNHAEESVREDLEAWTPKIRSGGVMAGHDYYWPASRTCRVQPAVDAYVRDHAIDPWWILDGDQKPSFMWVVP